MKTEEELIWEAYEDKIPTSVGDSAGLISQILDNVYVTAYQISQGNYELDTYTQKFLEQCESISEGRMDDIMQASSDLKQIYNRQRKY
jgi:formyltetrahydrofolate hydrolase